jgi:hypothetical protein
MVGESFMRRFSLISVVAALAVALGFGNARAEVVRFHYAPADACGNSVLVPGPNGAPGERAAWFGGVPQPYPRQLAPTHMATFLNPRTGRNINVPITFPLGTPRVEHRTYLILYNYTGYQIQVRFLTDGSVDVIYNSGALRPVFQ